MNQNNVWLNFAVKDLGRTREFYSKLDHFKLNPDCSGGGSDLVSVIVGENNLTDASSTETCLSLGATSIAEVDARLQQAIDAGASVFAKAGSIGGGMYGAGFADPDGHRWNFLYMESAK
jgi:predicted lactoylglutathione lyase